MLGSGREVDGKGEIFNHPEFLIAAERTGRNFATEVLDELAEKSDDG